VKTLDALNAIKDLIKRGQYTEARQQLREQAQRATGYSEFDALCRLRRNLTRRQSDFKANKHLKVALLGIGTTDFIEPALALALEMWGVTSEIKAADYNTYVREMLESNSAIASFRPDVAVVINSPTSLPVRPTRSDDRVKLASLVHDVSEWWMELCRSLHRHTGCEIVLDNFHLVATSPLGNLAAKLPWDLNTFLRRVNLDLGERAPSYVHINDVDTLASKYGLHRWFDARYWYNAKLPVSLECLVPYVRSIAKIISAIYCPASKCLVLDLDNTIWGGVVGDDGVDGIKIGHGDSMGEAFLAFQHYLLELKQRGVMLAVCSKNEEHNALAPFDLRPEMVIKRQDLVAFKANWDPKSDNLRSIAKGLNIGLDALVFVDDNPREREEVRRHLPDVRVVELSDDVADYPRLLDDTGWFEVVQLSAEDEARTDQYRSNALRVEVRESASDHASYLRSLAQIGVVKPYESRFLERIAQLINKTNQFNLVTRRQTSFEVAKEIDNPERLTAYVRLADRFGDNGLISAFSARRRRSELEIDQWLMSCRVFNRDVEYLLFNWVVEHARKLGVETIRGTFIPTAKNQIVCGHYASLGFDRVEPDGRAEEGSTHWKLEVERFSPFDVKIKRVDNY
jgi:FkbH-like protein